MTLKLPIHEIVLVGTMFIKFFIDPCLPRYSMSDRDRHIYSKSEKKFICVGTFDMVK